MGGCEKSHMSSYDKLYLTYIYNKSTKYGYVVS